MRYVYALAALGYWVVFAYFWLVAHGLLLPVPIPIDEPPFRWTSPEVP